MGELCWRENILVRLWLHLICKAPSVDNKLIFTSRCHGRGHNVARFVSNLQTVTLHSVVKCLYCIAILVTISVTTSVISIK